ncbi:MAG: DNA polymerase IV [Deltaproteobacteria bacterium]|nr:DNA polymerase IV [Deltaproteobacteria bacterium]MBW2418487.1 DNA polymerase IV [Deltaproteobacteria bacterium]
MSSAGASGEAGARTVLFAEVPAFYAAVERMDDPDLAERPVIVGGDPRKGGRVQSASAEAVAAGVVEGMPILEALERCPRARAVRTHMRRYREVAAQLRSCLREGVERLEPAGLEGAFLDATELVGSGAAKQEAAAGEGEAEPVASPELLAESLRRRVGEGLGLPLRVGIASVKFLAKLAAEEAGEGGLVRVLPGCELSFLGPLAVARLPGVGPKTEATLRELGVEQVAGILSLEPARLEECLGNHGLRIRDYARGIDDSSVRAVRHPKSLGQEHTFDEAQVDTQLMEDCLGRLARSAESALDRQGLRALRVAVKVRYGDQEVATRSRTLAQPVAGAAEIAAVASRLLRRTHAGVRPIRSLGLTLSQLAPRGELGPQLELFDGS